MKKKKTQSVSVLSEEQEGQMQMQMGAATIADGEMRGRRTAPKRGEQKEQNTGIDGQRGEGEGEGAAACGYVERSGGRA